MTNHSVRAPSGATFVAVDGLAIRYFDDEAVVFDPLSWDAHLLNPAAIAVLELLLEAPRSEEQIAAFLADALQEQELPRAGDHGRRLVDELTSLGLVRQSEALERAAR